MSARRGKKEIIAEYHPPNCVSCCWEMNGRLAAELEIRITDFRLCEAKFALFALHSFDGDITCEKGPG